MSKIKTIAASFTIGVVLTLLCVIFVGAIKPSTNQITGDSITEPLTPGDINTAIKLQSNQQQQQESSRDKASPEDFFSESQIKVYSDRVILDAKNLQWAAFEDTKSMLPVLNKDTNALQTIPKCPDEIKLGDIISYKSDYADGIIIHRVVFAGEDDEGAYFVMKGDNNPASDPGKIRCSQIQRKVVAIIY
jgi:hypothetical protein